MTATAKVIHLRRELEKVSGLLDYITNAPAAGIEITKDDRANVKAQLKVTKHILKITR